MKPDQAMIESIFSSIKQNRHKNVPVNKSTLDFVFGEDSLGQTPEDRAKTSRRLWCRSVDQLVEYNYKRGVQTGLIMCSLEAQEIFGFDGLFEAVDRGALVIPCSLAEPARSIQRRRLALGLGLDELAKLAGVSGLDVLRSEDSSQPANMRIIYQLCLALNLDPKSIGWEEIK